MAKLEVRRYFAGKSANECYQAILRAVEKAGYAIFKKREIAFLVLCDGSLDNSAININLMVPFGSPTAVTMNISGENIPEDRLSAEADRFFSILKKELG
jgi:hypothetical protein